MAVLSPTPSVDNVYVAYFNYLEHIDANNRIHTNEGAAAKAYVG